MLDRIVQLHAPGPLSGELAQLQELLRDHFATEEAQDGLHAATDRAAPHLLPAVHELFEEHRVFLEDVERLLGEARSLSAANTELLQGVRDLAQRLHAHEVQENQIFLEAVYTDLGAGD
jgi:hypothetical protein